VVEGGTEAVDDRDAEEAPDPRATAIALDTREVAWVMPAISIEGDGEIQFWYSIDVPRATEVLEMEELDAGALVGRALVRGEADAWLLSSSSSPESSSLLPPLSFSDPVITIYCGESFLQQQSPGQWVGLR